MVGKQSAILREGEREDRQTVETYREKAGERELAMTFYWVLI